MDTEFSIEQINQAKELIRETIGSTQQCFWADIFKRNNGSLPLGSITAATKEMKAAKELRLREDSCEHDWEYILV